MQRKLPPTAKSSITNAAALFVAKDLRPLTVVSREGFQELAAALANIEANFGSINPKEVLQSNIKVARHAATHYESLKSAVIEELATIDAVGVTCDLWEHESTKTPYLTVTAQYLKAGPLSDAFFKQRKRMPKNKRSHCTKLRWFLKNSPFT